MQQSGLPQASSFDKNVSPSSFWSKFNTKVSFSSPSAHYGTAHNHSAGFAAPSVDPSRASGTAASPDMTDVDLMLEQNLVLSQKICGMLCERRPHLISNVVVLKQATYAELLLVKRLKRQQQEAELQQREVGLQQREAGLERQHQDPRLQAAAGNVRVPQGGRRPSDVSSISQFDCSRNVSGRNQACVSDHAPGFERPHPSTCELLCHAEQAPALKVMRTTVDRYSAPNTAPGFPRMCAYQKPLRFERKFRAVERTDVEGMWRQSVVKEGQERAEKGQLETKRPHGEERFDTEAHGQSQEVGIPSEVCVQEDLDAPVMDDASDRTRTTSGQYEVDASDIMERNRYLQEDRGREWDTNGDTEVTVHSRRGSIRGSDTHFEENWRARLRRTEDLSPPLKENLEERECDSPPYPGEGRFACLASSVPRKWHQVDSTGYQRSVNAKVQRWEGPGNTGRSQEDLSVDNGMAGPDTVPTSGMYLCMCVYACMYLCLYTCM